MEEIKKPYQTFLEPGLYDRAKKKAKSIGMSFSAYLRMLVTKDIGTDN